VATHYGSLKPNPKRVSCDRGRTEECGARHKIHSFFQRSLESRMLNSGIQQIHGVGLLSRLTQAAVRSLDRLAGSVLTPDDGPEHQRTGCRGEEETYFWLRKLGYVMVARNYRSARRRGEIDLIAWDGDVLCFIEVKTRRSRDVKPAEAAVDRDKRKELRGVAREYLRRLPENLAFRFDVVSVYIEKLTDRVCIELFKNAFPVT
jgi:putative endonuclease